MKTRAFSTERPRPPFPGRPSFEKRASGSAPRSWMGWRSGAVRHVAWRDMPIPAVMADAGATAAWLFYSFMRSSLR